MYFSSFVNEGRFLRSFEYGIHITHTHEEGAGRAISRIIHRMKPPLSRSEISFYSTEVYADMRYAAAAAVNARFYGNNSLSLPGLHYIKQDGGRGGGRQAIKNLRPKMCFFARAASE